MEKKYNPEIHKRKSIRIPGYDYAQAGLYFITICTHEKLCLFGGIVGVEYFQPKMHLNDAGKFAEKCWQRIPEFFPEVVLHTYVIMPNHVHGIIELQKQSSDNYSGGNILILQNQEHRENNFQKAISGSVGSIVRGYKTGVTKWFRDNRPDEFPVQQPVWQRNYYEHIIRNEQSYLTISTYIEGNPAKWQEDKFYIAGT